MGGLPVVSRFATRPKLPFLPTRVLKQGGMTGSQKVVESMERLEVHLIRQMKTFQVWQGHVQRAAQTRSKMFATFRVLPCECTFGHAPFSTK